MPLSARPFTAKKFGDPQLAMDYRGLADPFTLALPIEISNSETSTLYFQATVPTPPAGYTITTQNLGSVAAQGIGRFLYTGIQRAKPAAPVDDSLTLKIKAFRDAAYTDQHSEADLSITAELFDRNHADYTKRFHDNFDDIAPTPTVSPTTGGSLNGQYTWLVTVKRGEGEELPKSHVTATISTPNNVALLSWGAVAGATAYRIYRVSGAVPNDKTTWRTTNTFIAEVTTTSYTDTGTAASATAEWDWYQNDYGWSGTADTGNFLSSPAGMSVDGNANMNKNFKVPAGSRAYAIIHVKRISGSGWDVRTGGVLRLPGGAHAQIAANWYRHVYKLSNNVLQEIKIVTAEGGVNLAIDDVWVVTKA